jgi:hypothetical protein
MVYKFVNEGELSDDEFQRLKEMLDAVENNSPGVNSTENGSTIIKHTESNLDKNNATRLDFKNPPREE